MDHLADLPHYWASAFWYASAAVLAALGVLLWAVAARVLLGDQDPPSD